jgi:hypothetical protein
VLFVGRHTAEDPNPRPPETLVYVVIEARSGRIEGVAYEAGLGAEAVRGVDDAPPYLYPLSSFLATATSALASPAGMDGLEGGWPILYGAGAVAHDALGLAIEEDWYWDPERSHTTEQVAYLVLGPTTACNDGLDNDGDGLVDVAQDPGCADALDASEKDDTGTYPCDDGEDNETVPDGYVDYREDGSGDPGCKSPSYFTESPMCQDGRHNDGDGKMDYDAGLSANGTADPAGPDPQCLGRPWRNNEWPGSSCGLGTELAFLLPALMWLHRRRRRRV